MSDIDILASRVYLIPPKGILEKHRDIIIEKLSGKSEYKYVNNIEIPCTRPIIVELIVDDECEICPYAIELLSEIISKCDKITAKIYNISYVKPPFEASATPTFRVNETVTLGGLPLEPGFLSEIFIEAYIRKHPELENLISKLKSFADQHGFKRNPNEILFKRIIYKLLLNIDKYGYPYCPCRQLQVAPTTHEMFNLNKDKICPCIYAVTDVKTHGKCLCGLFWSNSEVEKYINERIEKYGWIISEINKISKDLGELRIKIVSGGSKRYLESIIRKLEKLYVYLPD